MTARMRAATLRGQVAAEGARRRASTNVSISSQSRIEPSWPPHDGGDPVVQRQRAVRVGRDVEHREVVADEAQRRGRRSANATSTNSSLRRRARQRHPVGATARRAEHRHDAEDERRRRARSRARSGRARESSALRRERVIRGGRIIDSASLGCPAAPASAPRRLRAACSSRRAWRAPRGRRTRRPRSWPWATTPLPSLNRSGRMPS